MEIDGYDSFPDVLSRNSLLRLARGCPSAGAEQAPSSATSSIAAQERSTILRAATQPARSMEPERCDGRLITCRRREGIRYARSNRSRVDVRRRRGGAGRLLPAAGQCGAAERRRGGGSSLAHRRPGPPLCECHVGPGLHTRYRSGPSRHRSGRGLRQAAGRPGRGDLDRCDGRGLRVPGGLFGACTGKSGGRGATA
jgi:hypothetical protein